MRRRARRNDCRIAVKTSNPTCDFFVSTTSPEPREEEESEEEWLSDFTSTIPPTSAEPQHEEDSGMVVGGVAVGYNNEG